MSLRFSDLLAQAPESGPPESVWLEALAPVGPFSSTPQILWASPLDPGRRVYRSGNRVLKVVLHGHQTTGHLRNADLAGERKIIEALNGTTGVGRCLGYARTGTAEILVVEYVSGLPWRDYQPAWKRVLLVLPRLVGLAIRLSARGVAHGDLKPDNVLIDRNARPWVIDFDQAKQTGRASSLLANLFGARVDGSPNHGGIVQFVRQMLKATLPDSVLRFLRTVRRRLGWGPAAQIPFLAPLSPGASDQLKTLHRAWKVGAESDANAPGQGLCYYSLRWEGFQLPGERPWEERWDLFGKAVDWRGARILELGCNMGLLSTFAIRQGASDALGVDADDKILEANRLVQDAFGVKYKVTQKNFDAPTPWEQELSAFSPTIVTALSVLNWVQDKDRFLRFLGRFPAVLFEGHDTAAVESQRLTRAGFQSVQVLAESERARPILFARK